MLVISAFVISMPAAGDQHSVNGILVISTLVTS